MSTTRFCFCLSIKTGANIIGILVILTFIWAITGMIRYSDIYSWFVLPTLCFGFVTCFYVRCVLYDSKATRRDYFVFYIVLVAFVFQIYEYVLYRNRPAYVGSFCDVTSSDPENCRQIIENYFIYFWLSSIVINLYFAHVLLEFKNEYVEEEYLNNTTPKLDTEYKTRNSLYLPISNYDLDQIGIV